MKASELRIGNSFDYHGQTVSVLNIFKDGKVDFGYFEDSVGFLRRLTDEDCPKPIPLTEEWLLKFGFVSDPYQDRYVHKGEHFVVDINKTRGFLEIWESRTSVIIESVHQLQNLYFALTGEELVLTKEHQ